MHIVQQTLFPLADTVNLGGGGTNLHIAKVVNRTVWKPECAGPIRTIIPVKSYCAL